MTITHANARMKLSGVTLKRQPKTERFERKKAFWEGEAPAEPRAAKQDP